MDFLFTDASNDYYLVVKGDEARRRAFWYEWQYDRSGYQRFVSDAVWDQSQSAGIKGWQPAYGYRDHIEEV